MRFGVCTDIGNAPQLKELGYDYFESGFSKLGGMTDEEFNEFKQKVEKMNFYPEAMNLMLPGTFRLTGDAADLSPVKPFLQLAFKRAEAVGTKVVVFGSGGTRNMPEGFNDRERAFGQLAEYLKMAGEIAFTHDIEIAIEPLRFAESNIINLYVEACYLAERVNLPKVRCLADYYHMAKNDEGMEGISKIGHRLAHCHIACKEGRTFPMASDGHDYAPFFNALKNAGYNGRISVEGSTNDFMGDAQKSLELLKSLCM